MTAAGPAGTGRPDPGAGHPRSDVVAVEWDDPTGPVDLFSAAATIGSWVWAERRLHELLGGWAADAAAPVVVTTFDRVAMRHAWRAEVLTDRLPQLRELPRERLVRRPGPEIGDGLLRLEGQGDVPGRLAGWTAVATTLVTQYRRHLGRATPVADAPLRRWLPLVLASLDEDLGAMAVLGC